MEAWTEIYTNLFQLCSFQYYLTKLLYSDYFNKTATQQA